MNLEMLFKKGGSAVDKDIVLKIIGELYLNNYIANNTIAQQSTEISRLRTLLEQVGEIKEK
jgi:hypothetical protein